MIKYPTKFAQYVFVKWFERIDYRTMYKGVGVLDWIEAIPLLVLMLLVLLPLRLLYWACRLPGDELIGYPSTKLHEDALKAWQESRKR